MRDGVLLAVEQLTQHALYDFDFVPLVADPGGSMERYRSIATDLLSDRTITHIIGCYTSSSRKEIIPIVEKFDSLLWYPSHYEGFESCDSVIYGGAAPNQHLLPLTEWLLSRYGRNIYCIGSNYIWSWGNNRVLRELIQSAGGSILSERYLPIGCTDVMPFIDEIAAKAPDAVFCTLIGDSCYAFYNAYQRLATRYPAFSAEERPILSCSLSEPELSQIGPAAAGHVTASVYFESLKTAENHSFVRAFRDRFGRGRRTSADAEAAYIMTNLLAESIWRAGTDRIPAVKRSLYSCNHESPQGPVCIDAENNHAYLTPRIAKATRAGQFEVIWEADAPQRPDPYLTCLDVREFAARTAGTTRPPPNLTAVGS